MTESAHRGRRGAPATVALAVVIRDGCVLVARRPAGRVLAGTWEFPGGKVEPGEEPRAAALRELAEETGLQGEAAGLLFEKAPFSPQVPCLKAFLVTAATGEPRPLDSDAVCWWPLQRLHDCPMPAANRPLVEMLRRRFGSRTTPPPASPRLAGQ